MAKLLYYGTLGYVGLKKDKEALRYLNAALALSPTDDTICKEREAVEQRIMDI